MGILQDLADDVRIDALKKLFPTILQQIKINSEARGLGEHSFEIVPSVSESSVKDFGWFILQDNEPIYIIRGTGEISIPLTDDSLYDLTDIKSRTEFLSSIQAQDILEPPF